MEKTTKKGMRTISFEVPEGEYKLGSLIASFIEQHTKGKYRCIAEVRLQDRKDGTRQFVQMYLRGGIPLGLELNDPFWTTTDFSKMKR